MRTYLITYNHDGAEWLLELKAESADDAKTRLSRLANGRVDGELVAKIPGSLGPIAMAVAAIRNGLAQVWSPRN